MVFCNVVANYKKRVILSHNPYFNRWFSAIKIVMLKISVIGSHNPYFNRWFSAIRKIPFKYFNGKNVTILILIDGFLQ